MWEEWQIWLVIFSLIGIIVLLNVIGSGQLTKGNLEDPIESLKIRLDYLESVMESRIERLDESISDMEKRQGISLEKMEDRIELGLEGLERRIGISLTGMEDRLS